MVLKHIKRKRILVIGDLMLDVYTFGEVLRISPEAPVPVLRVTHESRRPGGAGNAILNLVSLGMEVVAAGRVGNDVAGSHFLQEMAKEGVDARGVFCDSSYQTPQKNRMIASGQQIVRIDYEQPKPLHPQVEKEVVAYLPKLFEKVEMIAISDYAKGFLTPSLLAEVIRQREKAGYPCDRRPQGDGFHTVPWGDSHQAQLRRSLWGSRFGGRSDFR